MYKQATKIYKPKRIRIFELIMNCTITMKTKSRFSRNVYAISDRIWCNRHLRHTATDICGIRLIAIFNRTKWLKIRFWKLKFWDLSILYPSLHSRFIAVCCGVLAAIICVPAACARRPRRPHCAVTALPLRTHCVHTALIQIAVGTPSHGAHFVHAQSARRGMAS